MSAPEHPSLFPSLEPRVIPFSDHVALLEERQRLWERIAKADAEIERLATVAKRAVNQLQGNIERSAVADLLMKAIR